MVFFIFFAIRNDQTLASFESLLGRLGNTGRFAGGNAIEAYRGSARRTARILGI